MNGHSPPQAPFGDFIHSGIYKSLDFSCIVCSDHWGPYEKVQTCEDACHNIGGLIKTERKLLEECEFQISNTTIKDMKCNLAGKLGSSREKRETMQQKCEEHCPLPSSAAGAVNSGMEPPHGFHNALFISFSFPVLVFAYIIWLSFLFDYIYFSFDFIGFFILLLNSFVIFNFFYWIIWTSNIAHLLKPLSSTNSFPGPFRLKKRVW